MVVDGPNQIKFQELFAWNLSDMLSIADDVITHELHIDPLIKFVIQRRRAMGNEKRLVIRSEVGKLAAARFVKVVRFQTLVANPVLV